MRSEAEIQEEMAVAVSEDAEIQSQRDPGLTDPEKIAYYDGHKIYMAAVAFTLAWTLGRKVQAPFTGTRYDQVTEAEMLEEWRTAKAYVNTGRKLPPGMPADHALGVVRALTWVLFPGRGGMPPALYA